MQKKPQKMREKWVWDARGEGRSWQGAKVSCHYGLGLRWERRAPGRAARERLEIASNKDRGGPILWCQGRRLGRHADFVPYAVLMIAVIVALDVLFFKGRFWERLLANAGIVLVFLAFYLRFLNRP